MGKNFFSSICQRPAILLLVFCIWVFFEYFFLGPYSYLNIHDNADSHQPRYIWIASQLAKGNLPFNFPQYAGGVDVLGNGTRYFDLVTIFHLIFPPWFAATAVFISQGFTACYFTFLLANKHLKLSLSSSVIAGAFAGIFQAQQLDFGLAFAQFPLLILIFERITKLDYKKLLFCSVLLGLWIAFTVPLTIYILILPCIILWFFSFQRASLKKFLLIIITSTLILVSFQIQFLISLLINSPLSHRANRQPDFDLISSFYVVFDWSLLSLPGVIIITLLFISKKIKLNFSKPLFLIFLNFSIILLVGSFSKNIQAFLPEILGFARGFNFDHILYILPFYAGLIFGLSIQTIQNKISISDGVLFYWVKNIPTIAFSLIIFQSLIFKGSNAYEWLIYGNFKTNFENQQVVNLIEKNDEKQTLFRFATTRIIGLENAVTLMGGETLGGYLNLYPKNFKDFWLQLNRPYLIRDENAYNSLKNWGNKLSLEVGSDFQYSGFLLSDYVDLNFLSLGNVKYVISFIPLHDNQLKLVAKPSEGAEWHLLSFKDKFFHNIRSNFLGRNFYIYENSQVFPRWYFVDRVNYVGQKNIINEVLPEKKIDEIRQQTWINSEIDYVDNFEIAENEAKLVSYLPDDILFKVNVESPEAFLVLLNSWSPFWKVIVDGKEREYEKAYDLFFGLKLKKGSHEVRFTYEPAYKF